MNIFPPLINSYIYIYIYIYIRVDFALLNQRLEGAVIFVVCNQRSFTSV